MSPLLKASNVSDNPIATSRFGSFFGISGSGLSFSTFLGGSGDEVGWGVAVDDSGSIYAVGHSEAVDFPTQAAIQTTHAGDWDIVVAKLFGPLDFFLAGTPSGEASGAAVDAAGAPVR